MKVFIISSSYVESTLLSVVDFIIGINIDEVILLSENHTNSELLVERNNIILDASVFSAVSKSDCVAVINNEYLPTSTSHEIRQLCYDMHKQLYTLDYTFNNCSFHGYSQNTISKLEIPTILLISIGEFAQIEKTELTILKLLSLSKNRIVHNCSPCTEYLMRQSGNVSNQKAGEEISDCQLAIYTIQYDNMQHFCMDNKSSELIWKARPDSIVVNVESKGFDADLINELFLHRFNRDVDCIVVSDYSGMLSTTNTKRPIYHQPSKHASNKVLFTNDIEFEKHINQRVISKVTMPDGIICV